MRVVVVVVVTMGKQSQLPGLAWDGSLTKERKIMPLRLATRFMAAAQG